MANVLQLMEKSGLNRNQISKISGISNTFLSKIERTEKSGHKIGIKRKTLINIAVSLNMGLEEINTLLMEYGHSELSTSDTLYFLAASENQTVTGILPLFNSLALEWFLIGMENKLSSTENASLVYALDQPSHALESPEHTHFLYELHYGDRKGSPVYKDMAATACAHRRKLITEALKRGNKISTYICSGCLVGYLRRWEKQSGRDIEDKYKMFLREHMQTLVTYIETYPGHYQLKLLKKCPRLRYELLYLPVRNDRGELENKISKVFFLGREAECPGDKQAVINSSDPGFGQGFGDLVGFATDLQSILDFFHKQHTGINDHFVDGRFDTPGKMAEHIRQLMAQNIP